MSGALPDDWLPASIAFQRLFRQYVASEYFANEEVCWRAANDALLRRLRSGQLPARAAMLKMIWDSDWPIEPTPSPKADADGMFTVPSEFWKLLLESYPVNQEIDWLAGDFQFSWQPRSGESCEGTVIGLCLESRHLPQVGQLAANDPINQAQTRSGGRSPANWWPDFAEELAVYIHENGIPEGQGHDGQSALIDAVFARMAEQGKPEPGRGTVQAVVNAVLRRIRSAGN